MKKVGTAAAKEFRKFRRVGGDTLAHRLAMCFFTR